MSSKSVGKWGTYQTPDSYTALASTSSAVPVVEGEQPPPPAMPDAAELGARMAVYGIELLGPPPSV